MVSKKLHSDFSFGFEFEGFAKIETFLGDIENYSYFSDDNYSWNSLPCNCLNEEDFRHLYNNVNKFINDKLHKRGRTHYDGSVKNYLNGYQSFEYSSPVFKFTPKNIKLIKDFFVNMENYGFGINETCGFHTHISFPDITENDAIWIVSQIAMDDNKINEFCYLHTNDDNKIIDFYNERYANKSFLIKIRNDIISNDYESLINHINSEKYRVIRIHPQGTLEWRGPRNFLNINNGIDMYFTKLSKIIDILGESLNETHINGISKKEYFDNIHSKKHEYYINGYKFSPKSKYIIRNGISCLTDKFGDNYVEYNINKISNSMTKYVIRHPEKLFSDDIEPFFNNVINKLKSSNSIPFIINYFIKNKEKLNMTIDNQIALVKYFPSCVSILSKEAFKKLDAYEIFSIIENMNLGKTYSADIDKNIKFLLKNINKNLLLNCSLAFLNNANWTITSIIELAEKGLYKDVEELYKLYSRYCRSYMLHNTDYGDLFPIKPEDLHAKMIELINSNLIIDITDNESFGKTYSPSPIISSYFNITNFESLKPELIKLQFNPLDFWLENQLENHLETNDEAIGWEVECEEI